jgi:LL-diaminopimelate aminotransferase
VAQKAKVMWINYPNSPTGTLAGESFYRKAIVFAEKHDIIIASDEAYSEIYFCDEAPPSILNFSRSGILVFNSLSKRSAMTCHRIGWVMGDAEVVDLFRKVKTNIDSGTPTFIQDGAVAALSDEKHVESFRQEYKEKRDILCQALVSAGLPDCTPESTLYIWQKAPQGMSALDFATRLLDEQVAIVTTPGSWISEPTTEDLNPGEGYIRFALVPSLEDTREAARRISALRL